MSTRKRKSSKHEIAKCDEGDVHPFATEADEFVMPFSIDIDAFRVRVRTLTGAVRILRRGRICEWLKAKACDFWHIFPKREVVASIPKFAPVTENNTRWLLFRAEVKGKLVETIAPNDPWLKIRRQGTHHFVLVDCMACLAETTVRNFLCKPLIAIASWEHTFAHTQQLESEIRKRLTAERIIVLMEDTDGRSIGLLCLVLDFYCAPPASGASEKKDNSKAEGEEEEEEEETQDKSEFLGLFACLLRFTFRNNLASTFKSHLSWLYQCKIKSPVLLATLIRRIFDTFLPLKKWLDFGIALLSNDGAFSSAFAGAMRLAIVHAMKTAAISSEHNLPSEVVVDPTDSLFATFVAAITPLITNAATHADWWSVEVSLLFPSTVERLGTHESVADVAFAKHYDRLDRNVNMLLRMLSLSSARVRTETHNDQNPTQLAEATFESAIFLHDFSRTMHFCTSAEMYAKCCASTTLLLRAVYDRIYNHHLWQEDRITHNNNDRNTADVFTHDHLVEECSQYFGADTPDIHFLARDPIISLLVALVRLVMCGAATNRVRDRIRETTMPPPISVDHDTNSCTLTWSFLQSSFKDTDQMSISNPFPPTSCVLVSVTSSSLDDSNSSSGSSSSSRSVHESFLTRAADIRLRARVNGTGILTVILSRLANAPDEEEENEENEMKRKLFQQELQKELHLLWVMSNEQNKQKLACLEMQPTLVTPASWKMFLSNQTPRFLNYDDSDEDSGDVGYQGEHDHEDDADDEEEEEEEADVADVSNVVADLDIAEFIFDDLIEPNHKNHGEYAEDYAEDDIDDEDDDDEEDEDDDDDDDEAEINVAKVVEAKVEDIVVLFEEDDESNKTLVWRSIDRANVIASSYKCLTSTLARPRNVAFMKEYGMEVHFVDELGRGQGVVFEWLSLLGARVFAQDTVDAWSPVAVNTRLRVPRRVSDATALNKGALALSGLVVALSLRLFEFAFLEQYPAPCILSYLLFGLASNTNNNNSNNKREIGFYPKLSITLLLAWVAQEDAQLSTSWSRMLFDLAVDQSWGLENDAGHPVTDDNKYAYVRERCIDFLFLSRASALAEIETGFQFAQSAYSLFPITDFLRMTMCDQGGVTGLYECVFLGTTAQINVDALKDNTSASCKIAERFASCSNVVNDFWQLLRAWDESKRQALLRFWSCYCYLPVFDGTSATKFSLELEPYNSSLPVVDMRLPSAITCTRVLSLPACRDKADLAGRIEYALSVQGQHLNGFHNI